jgi:tetratricopeptide (TPR) repeat protein
MEFAEQLRFLQSAQRDPARLALAAVDLAFPAASNAEKDALKQALEAAAIPHWCNETILQALLDLAPAESAARFAVLNRLNEVEAFEARGEGAVNIHESARLALRKRMAREEPERFRALSARAAAHFASDHTPLGRIEWIYHRLGAAPDEGAADCEALINAWGQTSYPQDRDALMLALYELERTGLVDGRARLEVLLCFGENQYEHSEITRVAQCAPQAIELAKKTRHRTGEARAFDLLGQVLRVQGHLAEALSAYQSGLQIRLELAAADPTDAIAQWGLAVAYSRLGDVYDSRAAFDAAFDAFHESFRICLALAQSQPTNPRWLREVAISNMRAGDVLLARSHTEEARAAFAAARTIIQQLAETQPGNEDWHDDLAAVLFRIGEMHDVEHATEAREALNEYMRICRALLSRAPDNAEHLRELAIGHQYLARIETAEERYAAADAELLESRRIMQQLVARDPTNAAWLLDLAAASSDFGNLLWRQGKMGEAKNAFEKALELWRNVSDRDPGNLQRQRDVAVGHFNIASALSTVGDRTAVAISHFEEASRIYAAIVQAAPDNVLWAAEQKDNDEQLVAARQGTATDN